MYLHYVVHVHVISWDLNCADSFLQSFGLIKFSGSIMGALKSHEYMVYTNVPPLVGSGRPQPPLPTNRPLLTTTKASFAPPSKHKKC